MAALTAKGGTLNKLYFAVNKSNASELFPADCIVERFICTASSSGTINLTSDDGASILPTALSVSAGDVIELGIPCRDGVTFVGGGTSVEGLLVISF